MSEGEKRIRNFNPDWFEARGLLFVHQAFGLPPFNERFNFAEDGGVFTDSAYMESVANKQEQGRKHLRNFLSNTFGIPITDEDILNSRLRYTGDSKINEILYKAEQQERGEKVFYEESDWQQGHDEVWFKTTGESRMEFA